MMDSGPLNILNGVFGGIEKMLSGKKCPQKVRAFRLFSEELLQKYIHAIETFDDLNDMVTYVSIKTRTAKL